MEKVKKVQSKSDDKGEYRRHPDVSPATLLSREFKKNALNPLKYRYDSERDAVLACLAYIIMETKTREAVPVLIHFLKRNWNEEEKYFYSLPLVARTLWRLIGQPEILEHLSAVNKLKSGWRLQGRNQNKFFDMLILSLPEPVPRFLG